MYPILNMTRKKKAEQDEQQGMHIGTFWRAAYSGDASLHRHRSERREEGRVSDGAHAEDPACAGSTEGTSLTTRALLQLSKRLACNLKQQPVLLHPGPPCRFHHHVGPEGGDGIAARAHAVVQILD